MKDKIIEVKNRLMNSELFKDSFWALFGNTVAKGLALIIGIVVANLLGSEDYGRYSLIKSTLIYIAIFSTFGLGHTGTKYVAQYKEEKIEYLNYICRDIIFISLCTSGFIAALVLIFTPQIASFIEMEGMNNTIRLSAIAVIFNAINHAQTGILAGFKKFKTISNYNMATGLYLCGAAIVLTYFWGLNGTVLALGSSYFFNFILNRITLNKLRRELAPIQKKISFKRDMVKFSLPLALQEGLQSLANWATIAVLVKLSNYSEYGIYSAAHTWTAAISFIPAILRNVTLSYLSGSNMNRKRVVKIMFLVNLISSGTFFLIVFLFSGIITSSYNNSFEGLQSVLNILVFSSVFGTMGSVFIQELISSSRNWLSFAISLTKSIITIGLGAVLIVSFSVTGALSFAISALIGNFVYLTSLIYSYRKSIQE